jgi:Domain of unknown function (DUF5666)
MTMTTKQRSLAIILGSLCVLPLRAAADPPQSPPNNLYRSLESGNPSHPAARVHGVIESIDYSSGTLMVRSGGRDTLVMIVPNTTIYGNGGYSGLSDLRRGQQVEISVYEVDGRLVAQSIRLK